MRDFKILTKFKSVYGIPGSNLTLSKPWLLHSGKNLLEKLHRKFFGRKVATLSRNGLIFIALNISPKMFYFALCWFEKKINLYSKNEPKPASLTITS